MASPDTKVSVLLNGGVDEQTTDELFGATVAQGGSPTLAVSRNTRLSKVRGTCTRAPEITEALALGQTAFGIVPEARSKRTLVLASPSTCHRIVADDGNSTYGAGTLVADDMYSATAVPSRQNAYVPARIVQAGALGGVEAIGNIASAYDATNDHVWYAWVAPARNNPTTRRLCVAVYKPDGAVVLSPTATTQGVIIGLQLKVGVTAHGANGVRVWYQDAVSLYVQTLSVSGNKLTPGTPSTAVVGEAGGFCVAAQDSTYAYIAASGVLYKHNVSTGAQTSVSVNVVGVSDFDDASVSVLAVSGGAYRVAVAFARAAVANLLVYGLYTDALVQVWAPKSHVDIFYSCSTHFLLNAGSGLSSVVFTGYLQASSFPTGPSVQLYTEPLSGGSTVTHTLHHTTLLGRGGQLTLSANETYPLLYLAREFGSTAEVGDYDYVDDPSAELWLMGSETLVTPVARFGVVRGIMAPAHTVYHSAEPLAGCGLPSNGTTVYAPYRKASLTTHDPGNTALYARFVGVSFAPEQPSVALDKDGVSLVSGALPTQWDGTELVELGGPLHKPMLICTTIAGAWPAGTYQVAAIYEWTDAAGLKHRSRPMLSGPMTSGGADAFQVQVALPDSFRNGIGQPLTAVKLYVSATNAPATMHLDYTVPTSIGADLVTFEPEPGDTAQPQLYSSGALPGEELTPQPPPPLSDIAIVGSRAWGVDAEIPTRLVYSKLRIAGIGFEFAPALEVVLPSGSGDVLAVRESAGTVAVFAERGVFQVADGGPNNSGLGGSFGSPYKLSDIGCHSRLSVLRTPVGIMFLGDRGQFCVLQGGGVAVVPGMELDLATQTLLGAFVLTDADEACFVVDDGVKVFNYALQRWTTWELGFTPTLVSASAHDRNTVMMFQGTILSRMDSDVSSSTADMYWETDWILLGGDFQDHVLLRAIVLNARRASAHGVTVSVFTNYETTASTAATWSAAEITSLADGAGRFTVKVEPSRQDTRAVKIAVAETASAAVDRVGMQPISLTIVSAVEAMVHEESILQGAYKGG